MTLYYIQFSANRENTWTSSLIDLGDEKFTFSIRWNDYCDCFFMDIQDLDGNYLISGLALTNYLPIRHQKLPYNLLFAHIDNKTYEPTIDNISEFGLFYNDDINEVYDINSDDEDTNITSTITPSSSDSIVTLIVSPSPSDATIILTASGYTQSGNTITVPYGTTVSYDISRIGYAPQSGSWMVTSTTTKSISLTKYNYTLTVNTIPSDAYCALTGKGITTTNKTITVPYNTSVVYSVSANNYTTQTGSWTVTENTSKTVTLSLATKTLTVSTTPSDAICNLTYNGVTYSNTKILSVPYGSTVSYNISRTGYITQTGSWTITSDVTKTITLSITTHSLTVITTPSGATCKLKYSTSSTWITTKTLSDIPYGTIIDYEVSSSGYITQSGQWTITNNTTKSITLVASTKTLTVITTPSDATCTLTYGGNSYVSKTATVVNGTVISYSVTHATYGATTGSITMNTNKTLTCTGTSNETTTTFNQPVLSSNGTLGGSSFAVNANSEQANYNIFKAFDNNLSTHWSAANNPGFFAITMYNPTHLKITKLNITNFSTSCLTGGSIKASNDNANYTTIISSWTNSVTAKDASWDIYVNALSGYKYWQIYADSYAYTSGSPTNIKEIVITGDEVTISYSWNTNIT